LNEPDNTVNVLQDLSAASLTKAIEESLATFPVVLARFPGNEVHNTPNLLWVTIDMPIDFFNGVYRSSFDPLTADAQIDEVMEEFRRRNLPMLWQVGPSSQPPDLRQRLLAHGFTQDEDEPGMAIDLFAMNEDFPVPPELDIRLVDNMSMLDEWLAVWGFGVPVDTIPLFQKVYARMAIGSHLPWRYYLGYLQGKPIATAILFFGAGVAALHTVGTLPEARHKGIGTAMTLAALREARREGYRVAILTASPYGERIYRRIGFREYCRISKYSWRPQNEPPGEQH
jgi:GNAT superfamily N-acetyltransferase